MCCQHFQVDWSSAWEIWDTPRGTLHLGCDGLQGHSLLHGAHSGFLFSLRSAFCVCSAKLLWPGKRKMVLVSRREWSWVSMRYSAVFFLLEKLLVSQPRTISASLPAAAPGHLQDTTSPPWPQGRITATAAPLQLHGIVPKAFTVSLNPAFHPLRMVAFLYTSYMIFPLWRVVRDEGSWIWIQTQIFLMFEFILFFSLPVIILSPPCDSIYYLLLLSSCEYSRGKFTAYLILLS